MWYMCSELNVPLNAASAGSDTFCSPFFYLKCTNEKICFLQLLYTALGLLPIKVDFSALFDGGAVDIFTYERVTPPHASCRDMQVSGRLGRPVGLETVTLSPCFSQNITVASWSGTTFV